MRGYGIENLVIGLDPVVKVLSALSHRRSSALVVIGAPDTGLKGGNEAA